MKQFEIKMKKNQKLFLARVEEKIIEVNFLKIENEKLTEEVKKFKN